MRDASHREGVLLLNPPFTDARGPYAAIPQLSAYLESRGIPVSASDLGAEFFRRFLTPATISRGVTHVQERFRTLNGLETLRFSQQIEYRILIRILREFPLHAADINWLATPFANFSDIQEAGNRSYLMLLGSMPYFPEIFQVDHQNVNPARFSPFNSSELLAAAFDETPYTEIFKTALEDAWPSVPPRLVGFSVVFTHQIIPAFQLAAMIRRMDPEVHITMGGPAISIFFRDVENPALFDLVDSLVLDDGEVPLEMLYGALGPMAAPLEKIPGVISCGNRRIHRSPPGPSMDLFSLPYPDLTLLNLDHYLVQRERITLPIRIGRGCSWRQCAFCRTGHPLCRAFQELPADHLFEIIRKVHREQGIDRFFFSTESANPAVLEALSRRLLKESLSVHWMTHTRVSRQLTRERCRLFARAGCSHMAVGIESMSDRILALMRKGINTGIIQRVLKEIEGGIPLNAYMMVGFPTETREEALASHRAVSDFARRRWLSSFSYSMFVLQRGSAIFDQPEKFGIDRMDLLPNEDLNPDTVSFAGVGMSREDAFELFLEFSRKKAYRDRTPEEMASVRIGRETIPLTHNLEDLRRMARTHWQTLVVPFGKWIAGEGRTPS